MAFRKKDTVGWEAIPAAQFQAGRQATRTIPGQSYARDAFESLVPLVLERVRLGAADIAATVTLYHSLGGPAPDRLALARIEHERERAATRSVRDRDPYGVRSMMPFIPAS